VSSVRDITVRLTPAAVQQSVHVSRRVHRSRSNRSTWLAMFNQSVITSQDLETLRCPRAALRYRLPRARHGTSGSPATHQSAHHRSIHGRQLGAEQ